MESFSLGGGGIIACAFALSSDGDDLDGAPLLLCPFMDTTMVGCSFSLTAVNRELGDSATATATACSSPALISTSAAALTETRPSRPVLFNISLAR